MITLPVIALLCSSLADVGMSQYVEMMLGETMLVQTNLKRLHDVATQRQWELEVNLKALLAWITIIKDKATSSFSERFFHLIILMIAAPLNALLISVIRDLETDGTLYEKLMGFLRGLANTFFPQLRYTNAINQSVEHVANDRIDNFSWLDLMSGGISFLIHHYFGDSSSVQCVLNRSLSNVRQANPRLPLLDNPITGELAAWVARGESAFARLTHLGTNIASEGIREMVVRNTLIDHCVPKTFYDSLTCIHLFFKDQFSSLEKFIISYLLSTALEKLMPTDDVHLYFKKINEAQALRFLLITLFNTFLPEQQRREGFLADFLNKTPNRPAYFKIFDLLLTISIIFLKELLSEIIEKNFSEAGHRIFHYIQYYYMHVSDYLIKLYSDIKPDFFQNQECLAYHTDNIPTFIQMSVAIFNAGFSDVQAILLSQKTDKKERIERGDLSSDDSDDSDTENDDEYFTSAQYSSARFAFASAQPSQRNFLLCAGDSEKPIWMQAGNFFAANSNMDYLRLQLLNLQCFGNDFFKDDMLKKDPYSLLGEFRHKWEILDATDLVGNWRRPGQGNFLREKGDEFKKVNKKRHYHGVALKRKEDGIVVIVTAGTNLTEMENIKADIRLFEGKFSHKYCKAGQFFVDYVKRKYLNERDPDVFVAHSLGCSFNMWMHAVTRGTVYTLNVDAFSGPMKTVLRETWKHHTHTQPVEDNIDSIIGSSSCINSFGRGHVGKEVYSVDTAQFGYSFISKHDIANIKQAFRQCFDRHCVVDSNGQPQSRSQTRLVV